MSAAEKAAQKQLFEKHDRVEFCIRLPLPPTKNRLRTIRDIPGKRPFFAPTTEYNVFKESVKKTWFAHWNGFPPAPLTGRVRLRAIVHLTRRGGDVINREEALCDALTECGAYVDDEQIDDSHLIRGEVIKGTGAIDVWIETIGVKS